MYAPAINRDRAAGVAPTAACSLGLLMWSTANILYMAGLDDAGSLPDEEAVLESLVRLWRGLTWLSAPGELPDELPLRGLGSTGGDR
jgi:hypothetical protein